MELMYRVCYGWQINIYIRVVRLALNVLRASFSPIFQYFSAVNVTRVSFSPVFQYFVYNLCMYAMRARAPRNCVVGHGFFHLEFVRHGFVRLDSSAIGVGVAVLVGKFMQGPWSAVPDIQSIR